MIDRILQNYSSQLHCVIQWTQIHPIEHGWKNIFSSIQTLVDHPTPPQFSECKYHLTMELLSRHWTDIDEFTDLADATQIEINTCLLDFTPIKPKLPKLPTDLKTRRIAGEPLPPLTEHISRADDSRRYSMPISFTKFISLDRCNSFNFCSKLGFL